MSHLPPLSPFSPSYAHSIPPSITLTIYKYNYNQLTYLLAEDFDKEAVIALINQCTNISAFDGYGKAALHWLSFLSYQHNAVDLEQILQALILKGAAIN